MSCILGCIGDDFTGSTDLANTLVRQGMRVIQTCGVPSENFVVPEADALVVSLKCRSIDPDEAVSQCREALAWLKKQGCRQFFWKYCSTFDSTARGNIGPVAKAMLEDLDAPCTIVCPAFPENKRSIYMGHLFVGEQLLSDSSMRDHPVTPMRDSNLMRLLEPQTGEKAGLVPLGTVRKGSAAVREAIKSLVDSGVRFIVTDAVEDAELFTIGEACAELALITGGSGISMGLPENFRRAGLLPKRDNSAMPPDVSGPTIILSGSCSVATRAQIARYAEYNLPMFRLDPLLLGKGTEHYDEALKFAKSAMAEGNPSLIHAGESPEVVAEIQKCLGHEASGHLVEEALGRLAVSLVEAGARRVIVAGGESSGAVVTALKITGLHIGPQIAPGVPWTVSIDKPALAIALKSGNFGGPDFFMDAMKMLP